MERNVTCIGIVKFDPRRLYDDSVYYSGMSHLSREEFVNSLDDFIDSGTVVVLDGVPDEFVQFPVKGKIVSTRVDGMSSWVVGHNLRFIPIETGSLNEASNLHGIQVVYVDLETMEVSMSIPRAPAP